MTDSTPSSPRLVRWGGFVFNRIILAVVIPASIFLLNLGQQQIQDERAQLEIQLQNEREQDSRVASYVSDMTDLVTNTDFNIPIVTCDVLPGSLDDDQLKMSALIRGRVLLAFSQVQDGVRSGQILRFLVDSGLIYVFNLTDLVNRNFAGADLWGVCLSGVALIGSNFSGAQLLFADMFFSDVTLSNFEGANLLEADLLGVTGIESAAFSTTTTLPDGTTWTPETDMTRFTDPEHPDFWQPQRLTAG